MAADDLARHLAERGVAAALVADGDATAVVQQLLADGWTFEGEETAGGKRVRYLVPPPELAARLVPSAEKPFRCAVCGGWFETPHALRAHPHRKGGGPSTDYRQKLCDRQHPTLNHGPHGQCPGVGPLRRAGAAMPYRRSDGLTGTIPADDLRAAGVEVYACDGCSFTTAEGDRFAQHCQATGHHRAEEIQP